MSSKNNSGNQGIDGTKTKHKGESQQSRQAGATTVSKKGSGKHFKDQSGDQAHTTDSGKDTKKQGNSI